jgi:uncharacterized membrane protein
MGKDKLKERKMEPAFIIFLGFVVLVFAITANFIISDTIQKFIFHAFFLFAGILSVVLMVFGTHLK